MNEDPPIDYQLFKPWMIIPVMVGLVLPPLVFSYNDSLKEKDLDNMAEVTSISQLMKANAKLRKHADLARKTVAQRDYAGPPGELICAFVKPVIIVKDGKTYYILEFRVDGSVAGQEGHNSARIGIMHGLNDTDRATAEQGLERLMGDLQCMGIRTADLSIEQIDAAVKELQNQHFKIRATYGKQRDRLFFNIVGLASAATDEQDYSSSSEVTDVVEENTDVVDSDEWTEDLSEDAGDTSDEDAQVSHEDFNPSDWVGYTVTYKPAKSPKALEFTVVSADDAAGTVVLERDGKKTKAKYVDIVLP